MRLVARRLWVCVTLGVAVGFAPPARAEDPYPVPEQIRRAAVKDHLRRARRARAAGKWPEAHAAYKAAFEATDATSGTERERAEIAGELGLCELALHRYRDAAEHLAWSLEQRKVLSVAQQKRFGEGLRKATSFVATLYLSVDPPDAEVLIDGTPVGPPRRTYALFFEPGKHMVRARAHGREEGSQSLDARAGTELTMAIQLPGAAVSRAEETAPAALSPARAQAPGPWASWPGTLRIGGIAIATAAAAAGGVFLLRAHVIHGDLREGDAARGRGDGEAPSRRVYACGGSFAEAISLPSGVDLWGSRRCDGGGDWSYDGAVIGPAASTIIAPPEGIPVRVLGGVDAVTAGDDATSVIFGVRAVAADASASDGKSSIAMILSYGARAIVRDSVIVAGNGKDGEPGKDAPSAPAKEGVLGNDGADACTEDFATGALPVQSLFLFVVSGEGLIRVRHARSLARPGRVRRRCGAAFISTPEDARGAAQHARGLGSEELARRGRGLLALARLLRRRGSLWRAVVRAAAGGRRAALLLACEPEPRLLARSAFRT